MARELSQEAVLDFLWGAGGRAPNTALLRHFQPFLRDPALTEQQRRERREYFKSLVNSLATVHPAAAPGASKDIVLRRRYRDLLDEELPPPPPEERQERDKEEEEEKEPPPPRLPATAAAAPVSATAPHRDASTEGPTTLSRPGGAAPRRTIPVPAAVMGPQGAVPHRAAPNAVPGATPLPVPAVAVRPRGAAPLAVPAGTPRRALPNPTAFIGPRCATGHQAASITVQVPAAAPHLVIPTPAEEIQGADPQRTNPISSPAAAPVPNPAAAVRSRAAATPIPIPTAVPRPASPVPLPAATPCWATPIPVLAAGTVPRRAPSPRQSIRCQLALLEVQGIPPSLPDDCGQQPRTMPSKNSLRNVPSRGLLVPLGQREHAWLVAMSAGCWARVRGLFLEEPELALQRDFMSGFTVLHWLAKHGDGPGLQELAAAARQAGLALDVDARSGCGYTPLHLAAIHGHQLVIKVLVLQLGCQVQVRDSSGRRPWEYLGSSTSGEIWQLLEAPRGTIMFPTQPLARSVSSASKVSLSAGRTALPACLRPQHGRGADSHRTGSESD
uniref:Sosondowah ankyrin repeat domain family member B n=1 Tax=Aquila chrysaetos chrysaetos TaxID=223781 RepID=A0A663FEJ5_AQUCH